MAAVEALRVGDVVAFFDVADARADEIDDARSFVANNRAGRLTDW